MVSNLTPRVDPEKLRSHWKQEKAEVVSRHENYLSFLKRTNFCKYLLLWAKKIRISRVLIFAEGKFLKISRVFILANGIFLKISSF